MDMVDREKPHVPFLIDFDYIEDESDEERRGQDSSEDELDIILHGTPKQKRKLTRSLSRGSLELSSSEDDFEKEMEKELQETMRLHEQQYRDSSQGEASGSGLTEGAAAGTSKGQNGSKPSQSLAQQFYDDIYFDSDSDSGEEGEKRKNTKKDKKQKSKHKVMTNDELLYDPDIDDENQRWVDRQRQKYRNQQTKNPPPKKTSENGTVASATTHDNAGDPSSTIPNQPKSDAVLNCPACMTTLCLDCQRHELYHNQYRAMFVLNCTIIRSERLKYPVPKKNKRWKKGRGKRRHDEIGEGSSAMEGMGELQNSEELYYPVKCSVCSTEVGVYDEDEVFHFFNVLTSRT